MTLLDINELTTAETIEQMQSALDQNWKILWSLPDGTCVLGRFNRDRMFANIDRFAREFATERDID